MSITDAAIAYMANELSRRVAKYEFEHSLVQESADRLRIVTLVRFNERLGEPRAERDADCMQLMRIASRLQTEEGRRRLAEKRVTLSEAIRQLIILGDTPARPTEGQIQTHDYGITRCQLHNRAEQWPTE